MFFLRIFAKQFKYKNKSNISFIFKYYTFMVLIDMLNEPIASTYSILKSNNLKTVFY